MLTATKALHFVVSKIEYVEFVNYSVDRTPNALCLLDVVMLVKTMLCENREFDYSSICLF